MKEVFQALEQRFNGDNLLVKICQKLTRGLADSKQQGLVPRLNVDFGEAISEDTFDLMIRTIPLNWSFFTRDPNPKIVDDWLFNMQRVFDNADLHSPYFTTVICDTKQPGGPRTIDGIIEIKARGSVTVQMNSRNPVAGYA